MILVQFPARAGGFLRSIPHRREAFPSLPAENAVARVYARFVSWNESGITGKKHHSGKG